MTKQYDYITIEKVHTHWFIIRLKEVTKLQFTGKKNHNSKYILVSKSELQDILVNGLTEFLRKTMITIYRSRKALVDKNIHEPFYAYIFKGDNKDMFEPS
jgi:hypothetical protein